MSKWLGDRNSSTRLAASLIASAFAISACTTASTQNAEVRREERNRPPVFGTNKNINRSAPANVNGAVRTMELTTGTLADTLLFDYCDPFASVPGVYERTCTVPQVTRLRIGGGWLARSARLIDAEWETLTWTLRLDGHEIDLQSFGTLPDRTIVVDGVEMMLREWNVVVIEPTSGTHTLHQVIERRIPLDGHGKKAGTYDLTWAFAVPE